MIPSNPKFSVIFHFIGPIVKFKFKINPKLRPKPRRKKEMSKEEVRAPLAKACLYGNLMMKKMRTRANTRETSLLAFYANSSLVFLSPGGM